MSEDTPEVKPQTIVRLKVENIQRIKAVEVRPDDWMVEVAGRNAQGKTSLLNAIAMAIGGRRAVSDEPVRHGENGAQVILETQDFKVTRTWRGDRPSTLKVTSRDRTQTFKSPQELLNSFTSTLTFDPLEFANADTKTQFKRLVALVGLDLSADDAAIASLMEERKFSNRKLKAVRSQLEGRTFDHEAPTEKVSIETIVEAAQMRARHDELERRFTEIAATMARLKQEAQDNRAERAELLDKITAADFDPEEAEALNARVDANREIAELETQEADLEATVDDQSNRIELLRSERLEKLATTKFPLPDLGVEDGEVYYQGVPFSQASGAERIKVSAAVAMAMAPQLRVMMIRDGSLLDDDSRATLSAMAEEHGMQIWCEIVAAPGSEAAADCAVVIENGEAV